jgi:hypothetical protein
LDRREKTQSECRRELRRCLVHAAGCKGTVYGCRCMVVERFNYDPNWTADAVALGVRIPRAMRRKFKEMYEKHGPGEQT